MLNNFTKVSAIAILSTGSIIAQVIPPAIAFPAKGEKQLYIGNFDGRKVYLLPQSIKPRGNLKRFQTRDVYRTEQTDPLNGYKYTQSVNYWTANCQEGSIGFHKSIDFDKQGNQVGEFVTPQLKFKIPAPNEMREQMIDSACDYKK